MHFWFLITAYPYNKILPKFTDCQSVHFPLYLFDNYDGASVFWNVTLCGLIQFYRGFGGYCCLCVQCRNVSCSLKREATISSIMLIPTYQTTRCHKPEDQSVNVSPCSFYCFCSIARLRPHTQLLASMTARTLIPDKDFTFKHVYWSGP